MAIDKECLTDLSVEIIEKVLVPPCRPSPEKFLYLSKIDCQKLVRRILPASLLYNAVENVSADPAKVIREALPKALGYYYSLAGRLRHIDKGKLQVECTDEGVLFIEATSQNNVSVLDGLEDLEPSFKKLHFEYPPDTNIEDMHLLVLQVTRFKCGGFVLVASFHHSIFDGKGVAQFLRALGEISRGHVKPSTEPVWCRELLKPRDPPHVEFRHAESVDDSSSHPAVPKTDELLPTTVMINSDTINKLKERLMEECIGLECTSFEIVAALTWRARTKAIEIPHDHTVKLFFAADARRSFKPPLPEGYYGNAIAILCVVATVQELLNGSVLDVVKMIQKAKILLNDQYLRSTIDSVEINSDLVREFSSQNSLIVTDWRWLGFEKADFGWGEAASVTPLWGGVRNVSFYLPAKNGDGMKVQACMEKTDLKVLHAEMQQLINGHEYQMQ